jgi:hypothetical protein
MADEVIPSIDLFKPALLDIADRLSGNNDGLFLICYGDFGHNNIVVDDDYKVLGVIDWDFAFVAPWEVFADFPLTFRMVPKMMDAPWNYDEEGNPKDEDTKTEVKDRARYVEMVEKVEAEQGVREWLLLSKALRDESRGGLITAMKLYQNGNVGFYRKMAGEHLDGESRDKGL